MANEILVQTLKRINSFVRSGNLDAAYDGYCNLFGSPDFLSYRPEDQRSALKLMIHAKGIPTPPTPSMIEAHHAAIAPLIELVSRYSEPTDYEMLGMCQVIDGDEGSADKSFRAGLALERERSPQSDLCAALMKRISLI